MFCGNVAADCRFITVPLLMFIFSVAPVQADGPPEGTFYFHTDHLGSLMAISNSSGDFVRRMSYDPNGAPRVVSNSGEETEEARFTGKSWEPGTGLYYFGARWFDPTLGRFLSPDAARQTSSPYGYVGAAPLQRVDPDGNHYTDFDSILKEVVTYHGFDLNSAEGRLQAGYMARMQAIEERAYFYRRSRSLKRQHHALRLRISAQEEVVKEQRRDVQSIALRTVRNGYEDLTNVARKVRLDLIFSKPKSRFVTSKAFEAEVNRYLKIGRPLPGDWKRVKNDLYICDGGQYCGPNLERPKRILESAIEKFKNIRLRAEPGEGSEANRLLSKLRLARMEFKIAYKKASANAKAIDNDVMPQLDVYINDQRRALGLSPVERWSEIQQ